ncbi:MAG: ATP-dependent acyl-CoA ligase [Alphaproteobacteria bacterium]|nr:MAG: ATP-dependent acyl-CoA ligase [Alphaproteobacteria bacterium]
MAELCTVFDLFKSAAERYGAAVFLHIPAEAASAYSDRAVDLTYGEAMDLIGEARTAYAAAGLSTGVRVGLLLDNRVDFFIHWFALNGLGVSVVPLNGEASPEDLAYIADDSGLSFIVALPERRELASRIVDNVTRTVPVVSAHDLASLPVIESNNGAAPSENTECALLYTSGSTGKPKGCMLSNSYFRVMGDWYRNLGDLCTIRPGQERLLTPLPLVHMNALATSTMCMIMTGGCIIQLDRFHPRTWWKSVATSGATIVHYLGVLPAILLNLDSEPFERDHTVRFGFGAGVNPKHHKAFEDRFGFPLIEAWSMTEVGGAAAVIANREPRHVGTCCFGKPEPFMEWRLVDDAGKDVEPGQPGELLVRRAGPDPRHGFFSGYFGMPEETEKAWAGGWFHTGDIVREGPDGSLHFVDRKKSIVRRSGENISSLEVEAVLSQIAGVQAVGVAPVPDEIRGEEVFAALVMDEKSARDEAAAQQIVAAALESLTYYKVPGYIAFVDALPLTASQKLQRGELKSLAKVMVDKGEAFDLRALKKRPRKAG